MTVSYRNRGSQPSIDSPVRPNSHWFFSATVATACPLLQIWGRSPAFYCIRCIFTPHNNPTNERGYTFAERHIPRVIRALAHSLVHSGENRELLPPVLKEGPADKLQVLGAVIPCFHQHRLADRDHHVRGSRWLCGHYPTFKSPLIKRGAVSLSAYKKLESKKKCTLYMPQQRGISKTAFDF